MPDPRDPKDPKESNDQNDHILESRFLAHPETGFAAIYDRYAQVLFGYIYRFVANADVAEEILHDVFLQVLNGKYIPTPEGNLKAWLFTVAKNRALNAVARQKFEVRSEAAVERATDPISMDAQLIQRDLHTKLEDLRQNLPLDLKQTWDLRSAGLNYQQIALQLKIPVGTVKSRFSRLVDVLRKDFL